MQLQVNGKPREAVDGASLLAFLEQAGIDHRIVAVERNGTIVKRDRFAETPLAEGDQLEIVRMVGGG
ncbi:MAG: sulfur carrier protein ThiS [Chloroflexi bacterium]|nr:sulfur carrier protein ThiS [Chloroflexota bacterium]